jgi:RNA polymerase sigma factor (sigma-70 family)
MPFDPSQFIEEQYDNIVKVIQSVCRKKVNQPQEIEECVSYILEQLVNNDYAILRSFKDDGRAKLQTYLYTVFNRLLIDKLRKEEGYFRPSVHAKRLNIFAERLERLLFQKKHTVEESYQILKNDPEFTWTYDYTSKLANELWRQDKPVVETHENIDERASSQSKLDFNDNPEKVLQNKELINKRVIIEDSLENACQGFSHEDSLILKLRFTSQKSVSEISRILGQSRKVVERKIRVLLNHLRDNLLSKGMTKEEVSEIIKIKIREKFLR